MNKTRTQLMNSALETLAKNAIAETLIKGYGFTRDETNKLNLGFIKKEASIEPPTKGGDLQSPDMSTGSSVETPDLGTTDSPDLDMTDKEEPKKKPSKPENPKPKSKDWNELMDEILLYIDYTASLVGDVDGKNKLAMIQKLHDELKNRAKGRE